ncbi:MAG: glycosyltransferase, partial [Clostridium sp.]|nr:glycosyltransferase [Clostridium sp.]
MEKGLVSFIIATYRHFEGVYPTLDSLFMQDYPRVEIIFSDDGSPEYEKEIPAVKAYVEAHKGPNIVRVLYNRLPENQGTIRNCNSAYRLASGEYLKDLAPEDTLSRPDALRRYVDFLEKEKVLCCFSRQEGVDASGKLVPHLASSAEDYETLASLSPDQLRKRLFVRNCLPAPAFFAKTELFRTYGYYPEEV